MEIFERLKEISEKGAVSRREPYRALILSLCPGLGQHYAGHIVRGIALYISLIIGSWLLAILFLFIESRLSIILFIIPPAGYLLIALDAYRLAGKAPADYRLKWYNRAWIYGAVFLALLFTVNPLMDYTVGKKITRACMGFTSAMEPTILEHDVLLINKLAYLIDSPGRGDIAVLNYSGDEEPGVTKIATDQLIRRIVALPGDTIEVMGREVYLNGKLLREPYAYFDDDPIAIARGAALSNYSSALVPPNSYFVLGDNRRHSLDSRDINFIERERLVGKITKVYWSWNFDEKAGGPIKWNRVGLPVN
jgi:signal peptidase I